MSRVVLRLLAGCTALAAVAFASGSTAAERPYPSKPIRLVVGVPPGGTADFLARVLGQKLGAQMAQPVVIDNRPGANQTIAAALVAGAAPDGYTFVLVPAGHAINPSLYRLSYDSVASFSPIGRIAEVPYALTVHPSLRVETVKQLVAHADARSGGFTFGSSGTGSASHLAGELFRMRTGVALTHVPYKGQAQVVTDLLRAEVKLAFCSVPTCIPHIREGRLIALGVASRTRSSALPDVPTIDEAGIPGFDVTGWYGVLGPSGMSRRLVNVLNSEMARALQQPDTRSLLSREGADPIVETREAFMNVLAREIAAWRELVAKLGLRVD
jgi:tripartite-type tricarboxylate transporter receptor subunit TctC